MTRFIVIHGTPAEGTQEELIAVAKKLYASLPDDIKSLNSWWLAGENGKLFCEWEAPDEDAIVALCEPVNEYFPVESIHLVTWLNPAWYT